MLDLSLAKSYMPICYCVYKTMVLVGFLAFLWPMVGYNFQAYVLTGCFLYADRVLAVEHIFNGNTLVLAVFFSIFLNQQRAKIVESEGQFVVSLMANALWVLFSGLMLFRADLYFSVFSYLHVDCLLCSICLSVLHCFIRLEEEPIVWVVVRASLFIIVSVSWMYIVNARYMNCGTVFDSIQCVTQFSSILFTERYVMLVVSLALFLGILYMHRADIEWYYNLVDAEKQNRRNRTESHSSDEPIDICDKDDYEDQLTDLEEGDPPTQDHWIPNGRDRDDHRENKKHSPSQSEIDEDTMALFQQAKSSMNRSAMMQ